MKLKHIGLLVLAVALTALYLFIDPSEVDFLPKCPIYGTTGIYCPGCGSQRATHQLLNLNILGVLEENVLFLVFNPEKLTVFYQVEQFRRSNLVA